MSKGRGRVSKGRVSVAWVSKVKVHEVWTSKAWERASLVRGLCSNNFPFLFIIIIQAFMIFFI